MRQRRKKLRRIEKFFHNLWPPLFAAGGGKEGGASAPDGLKLPCGALFCFLNFFRVFVQENFHSFRQNDEKP